MFSSVFKQLQTIANHNLIIKRKKLLAGLNYADFASTSMFFPPSVFKNPQSFRKNKINKIGIKNVTLKGPNQKDTCESMSLPIGDIQL